MRLNRLRQSAAARMHKVAGWHKVVEQHMVAGWHKVVGLHMVAGLHLPEADRPDMPAQSVQ